ncbi:MAG: M48 family metalloprotease [Pseudomonadota bacterium]
MRRRGLGLITSSIAALVLSACASTITDFPDVTAFDLSEDVIGIQAGVVEAALDQKQRVDGLAWPLLAANTDLCGDLTRKAYGITFGNDETVRALVDGLTSEQVRTLGYDASPIVLGVSDGSPAAEAGLQRGAVPVKIGETVIGGSVDAIEDALRKDRNARAIAQKTGIVAKPLPMAFELDGASIEFTLQPEPICDVGVRILGTDAVNASAGRRVININRGIANYLESDRDLSIVIAHELGHVAAGHVRKLTRNNWVSGHFAWGVPLRLGAGLVDLSLGAALERFAGWETPPGQSAVAKLENRALGFRQFEREADYLAVYFAARAGVDLDGFEELFSQLAELSIRSTYGERSHPITSERRLALRLARDEVEAKQLAGEPLVPEGWPSSDRFEDE